MNNNNEWKGKKGSDLRKNADKNNIKEMIKLQSDITELKNKIDYLFRNNIDNDKIKREFKLLNSRKESNNMRYSIPSYHSDNKNIEHEIEQKQNQRIRRLLYLGIRWIIIRSNTILVHIQYQFRYPRSIYWNVIVKFQRSLFYDTLYDIW